MISTKTASLFCSLILIPYCALSFANPVNQNGKFWGVLNAKGYLSKNHKMVYQLELQTRLGHANKVYDRNLFRAAIGYRLSHTVTLWGGYDFIPSLHPDTSSAQFANRLWQQLSWQAINSKQLRLKLRSRLEQRGVTDQPGIAWRFRQKLIASLPSTTCYNLTPIISDELFVNLNHPSWVGNETINQNRVFIGFSFPYKSHDTIQIGYMNQVLFRQPARIMNHILRIMLSFDRDS